MNFNINSFAWREFMKGIVESPSGASGDVGLNRFNQQKSYKKDEVILINDAFWEAKGDIEPGEFNENDWNLLDNNSTVSVPAYEVGVAYALNDKMLRAEVVYKCISAYTSNVFFESNRWERYIPDEEFVVKPYSSSAEYQSGVICSHEGSLYQSNGHRAAGVWPQAPNLGNDNGSFTRLTMRMRGAFSVPSRYETGDIILHDNQLIIAKNVISPGNAFDATDWHIPDNTGPFKGAHGAGIYKIGDVVTSNNALYIAKTNHGHPDFGQLINTTNWERLSTEVSFEDVDGERAIVEKGPGNTCTISGRLNLTSTNNVTVTLPETFDAEVHVVLTPCGKSTSVRIDNTTTNSFEVDVATLGASIRHVFWTAKGVLA